jgi:hypothetical protein
MHITFSVIAITPLTIFLRTPFGLRGLNSYSAFLFRPVPPDAAAEEFEPGKFIAAVVDDE